MRLANGSGSIVCLDKTGKKRRKPWAVRITTGWKDGKQVRKYVGYYATQQEAIMALADYHKGGLDLDLSKLTLNEVYNLWIERVKKKNLSESVLKIHHMAYSKFGKLGNAKFNTIKAAHLQDWLDGINLKPSSKGKLKGTMIQLYKYAVANDIVVKNYAESLEINEKVEQTGKVFTTDEIETIWKMQDRFEAKVLLVLLYTGMRIGELLIIKRDDIDFENGYMVGGIKTEAGKNRVIPIHNRIAPIVKELLGDSNWLIQNTRGNQMRYNTAFVMFKKFFEEIGITHTIHDARKTCVSWLHSSGIPIETVRIIVGHSGKGVTEKVYLYKEPKELVDIVNSIEIPY